MYFYSHLITILYPFVILGNNDDLPPVGTKFVIDYHGTQVVTYTGAKVIAED